MKKQFLVLCMLCVFLIGCGNANSQNVEETQKESQIETEHTHTYAEEITTEATCEADGVKTFTCECGDSYTEAIIATGHNYEEVADSAVEATCANEGKEVDTKCTICENVITGATIPALAHSYGEYIYNNDATTSADGTETATCSVCGGKTSRTKAGTMLVLESFPYELNVLYDDGRVGYFYCVYEEYEAAFGEGFHDTVIGQLCDAAFETTWQNMLEYDSSIIPLDNNTFPYGYDSDVYVGEYAEGTIWVYTSYIRYKYPDSDEIYVWH